MSGTIFRFGISFFDEYLFLCDERVYLFSKLKLSTMIYLALVIPFLCIVFLGFLVYSAPEVSNEV